MSPTSPKSLYQIRMEGWKALTERLGPSGAMRFMMQYDPGYGDYSKERHDLFAAVDLEDLLKSMDRAADRGDAGDSRATRIK
jgi:hypothetical protein